MKRGAPFDNTPNFRRLNTPAQRDSNPGLGVPVPIHSGEFSTTFRKAGVIINETHYRSSVAETGTTVSESWQSEMTLCQKQRSAGYADLQTPCGITHGSENVPVHGVCFDILKAGWAKPAWLARVAYIFRRCRKHVLSHALI